MRTKRASTKRSPRDSSNTLCSSLLLLILVMMGLLTITLNIIYIRIHHNKKHRSTVDNMHLTTSAGGQAIRVDRQGNVLHHEISKVKLQDLGLHDDALPPYNPNMTTEQARQGKEPLIELLHDAGVKDIDPAVLQRLPAWDTIQQLYGPGPILFGTETCAAFRESVSKHDASLGVAGLFNTGTNLMALYLEANCKMPFSKTRNKGIRWQVPWGKHMLAAYKWINTAGHEDSTDKTTVLPVVLVRDPYGWMKSMCANHYAARWHYTLEHCPNLVPNEYDYKLFPYSGKNIPVRLDFDGNVNITSYDSLAHVWSEWYRQYVYGVDYPRIIVRYEDLMYYPRELTQQVCECAGGVPLEEDGKFTFLVDSAKWGPGEFVVVVSV